MTRRFVDHEEGFSAGTPATTAPHLVTIMWRRKLIIVTSVVLALVAGWVIFTKITPTYSSSTKLLLKQDVPKVTVGAAQLAAATPTFSVNTEFEIVKSTAVLEQALRMPEMAEVRILAGVEKPVAYLQNLLQMTAGKTEDIMLISADCPNAQDAAAIVNGVAQAYINYNKQQQVSTTADRLVAAREEKAKREVQKLKVVKDLNERKRTNGILYLDNRGSTQMSKLASMLAELAVCERDTRVARVRFERLEELRNQPAAMRAFITAELVDLRLPLSAFVSDDVGRRQRAEEDLAAVEYRLGPKHRDVERLRRVLDKPATGDANAELVNSFRVLAAQKLATAMKTESELKDLCDKQREVAMETSVQEQAVTQLQNEADGLAGEIGGLDEQIKNLEIAGGAAGTLKVDVLDRAQANPIPVSPQKNKILGLALVAGLAMGMTLAMVRDLLDQRLRSLAEIEDTLGTRILGTVPTLGKKVHPLIAGKTVDTRPVSDVAEAYRSIRTSLFVARSHGETRTILVTSALPGEGKTTTVSNLAIAAAQMGRRVLLIDADCRMPSLHLVFKINDGLEKGLSSVLTHQAKAEDIIRPTGIENLDILTAGPLSSRPAEMLNGNGFEQLLTEMAERYEHVFIDSPPVVPVADARVLSAMTDVTVLVLRAEKSTRSQTLRARDALEAVGGRLLGVVVNDAPRRQAQYGCDFDVYPASDESDQPQRRGKARRRAIQRVVPALPDGEDA